MDTFTFRSALKTMTLRISWHRCARYGFSTFLMAFVGSQPLTHSAKAIHRWNSRLEGEAGIKFDLRFSNCPRNAQGNVVTDQVFVVIRITKGSWGRSTCAAMPIRGAQGYPFWIEIDPEKWNPPEPGFPSLIGQLTHELGVCKWMVRTSQGG